MDKQTAKKIEVVPCPMCEAWDLHDAKERFVLKIGVEIHPIFPDNRRVCGTEAEARDKAQELESQGGILAKNGYSYLSQEPIPTRAAAPQVATSAETRPPDTYELLTREILTIRHAVGKAIPLLSQLAPARAAAPVEPPACQTGECFFRAEEGSKYCKHHRSAMEAYDAKLAATEPVEQAPRPQEECPRCGGRNGSHQPGLPCWDKARRTASSPAARPQVMDLDKALADSLEMQGRAARVAQPTRRISKFDCTGCGKPVVPFWGPDGLLDFHCPDGSGAPAEQTGPANFAPYDKTDEYDFRPRPAAPVVAQRTYHSQWDDATINRLITLDERANAVVSAVNAIEYINKSPHGFLVKANAMELLLDGIRNVVSKSDGAEWRIRRWLPDSASQRTEGEGQTK